MTLALFLLGLVAGAASVAMLLGPRLRSAMIALHGAAQRHEAELEAARRLSAERQSGHERQLAELRRATEEKIALVAGNREQLADQMKAISTDTLRQVSEQVEKLATAQRDADQIGRASCRERV